MYVMVLLCIGKVPGLILGPQIGYADLGFSLFSSFPAGS